MKISSLVLLLPLSVLSGQALAFYQKTTPRAIADSVSRQTLFSPIYGNAVHSPMQEYGHLINPVFGCNCSFCSMLRQAATVQTD